VAGAVETRIALVERARATLKRAVTANPYLQREVQPLLEEAERLAAAPSPPTK
jgi:hypothetical protein